MQELERPEPVDARHWGRRAFVFAWIGALGLLGAGAALRWRRVLEELTRTPTAAGTSEQEPTTR